MKSTLHWYRNKFVEVRLTFILVEFRTGSRFRLQNTGEWSEPIADVSTNDFNFRCSDFPGLIFDDAQSI